MNNKLIIAAAGSWKTTFIINEALSKKESVLITTFTEANEEEIRKKIIEVNKFIPDNITIQTWFSFLIKHWVKPYQWWIYDNKINWLLLVDTQSWKKAISKSGFPIFFKEEETNKHYFTKDWRIFSDKLSKFVIKMDRIHKWEVINRLSRIYKNIFIDEVQDLAWNDLDLLKLLFNSNSNILLVWDPRQVTYLTHNERKYWKYKNWKIIDFIENECKKDICIIDSKSFNYSYRNNLEICNFSSKLYPEYLVCNTKQSRKTRHEWIFLVKESDINDYILKYNPQILRYSKAIHPELNYGISKWLWFDRVLIYPTQKIWKYLINWNLEEIKTIIPKFYVAITRAKFSVWIVINYKEEKYIDWINKWTQKKS